MRFHKIDKKLLRRLCSRQELSDVDIAARFGVTREAIRFARNRMGITGRGLARLRLFWQRAKERKRRKIYDRNPILRKIAAQTRKRGIAFELLTSFRTGRWMRIGNSICYQLISAPRPGFKNPKNSYVTLRRPKARRPYDFLIVKLPRGWLVLPHDRLPRRETMFAVGHRKKTPGAIGFRHDWADYYHTGWDWLPMLSVSDPTLQRA